MSQQHIYGLQFPGLTVAMTTPIESGKRWRLHYRGGSGEEEPQHLDFYPGHVPGIRAALEGAMAAFYRNTGDIEP